MRHLASFRKIAGLRPIDGADAIECAIIDGWAAVVKKDEFKEGDTVVYLEIDSWVPHNLAPYLSKGKVPEEFNGVPGARLRTMRLRGQLSQGLVIPLSADERLGDIVREEGEIAYKLDLTDMLGIQKWEPPIPPELAGKVCGFPGFIPKTEEDRIQNLVKDLETWATSEEDWEVSEKVDGTSMTVYARDEDYGVCGRNWQFLPSVDNAYTATASRHRLREKLADIGKNLAIQGELVGPSVKGIKYGFAENEFLVFRVYDLDAGVFLEDTARNELCASLGLSVVPVPGTGKMSLYGLTVESVLAAVEQPSMLNSKYTREGLVFRNTRLQKSFKAISNAFLLKHGG